VPTGSATEPVRVASPFCAEPRKAIANAKSCSDCEANFCEPPVAKGCDNFAAPEKQEQCKAALRCMRSTNCAALGGALECYCGPGVDIMSCRADKANASGPCKSDIIRGYPPEATADFIVMNSTRTDIPAAAAMALSQCDYVFCGPPEQNGHNQCLPYCN
jgi:hypothetical protein